MATLTLERTRFAPAPGVSAHITVNPGVRFGKPCIKGTRIAVADILQWMASGMSREEILEDYPALTNDHIRAALCFAAGRESSIRTINAHENFAFA